MNFQIISFYCETEKQKWSPISSQIEMSFKRLKVFISSEHNAKFNPIDQNNYLSFTVKMEL